ncbi:ABC transporter substrate-binding protein [Paenibacillus lutrae]|uniref:Extracellular solute-binding protein n=1 Tax=Paenibacillus lutrae TaxID=2078573 RepID=A0A7X3FEJ0_9BACL|nr:extracellular solute-binding protein [Paenibacillus lutrae]MVO98172.1 extracellular solute-binding protein [Paenibacillus lutrae]
MKAWRRTTLLLTVAVLIFMTACGSISDGGKKTGNAGNDAGKGDETIELTFANWISTEDSTKEAFAQLVAGFEAAHPNIKIKSLGIPFNEYKDQMLVASTGGNTPDVLMANQGFTPAFASAGIAQPLEPLLGSDVIADILPPSKSGVTFGSQVIAMPWTPHPNALFWNKTLFRQAGLDPDKPPRTIDEMLEYAAAIAKLGKNEQGNPIYGIGETTKTGAYTGQMLLRNTLARGGKFIDDQGKLSFDQGPALTDSLNDLRELAVNKITPVGAEIKDLRAMFGTGSLGMLVDGDFGRNNFRQTSGKGEAFDREWGVATIPAGVTGRSETVFTEHQLLISASTKHAGEAAEFVNYLVSKEAMILYHKLNGVMSSRISVASLPELNLDDYAKVFNEQMKTASLLPTANPKFDQAMKEASNLAVLAATTNEPIPALIDKIMPKLKALYK